MGVITNLRGREFERLTISPLAEPEMRNGYAYWPCTCACGKFVWVRGKNLIAGRTVSCGCQRANPNIRRAARLQTPAKRRRAIARMGQAARRTGRETTS